MHSTATGEYPTETADRIADHERFGRFRPERTLAPGESRLARRVRIVGYWLHVFAACLYCFLLPLATAPKDIAFVNLLVVTLVRLYWTAQQYPRLLRDPLAWVIAAWALWQGLSILWSTDRAQGLDEFRAMRVLITPLLLWPVLPALPVLIGSLLLGVFMQNVVQLMQGLEWFGLRPADNDRLRGLIHPIKTATFCAAAMCWHISASLWCRGLVRWMSVAGLAAASLGLLATGSRGPWIAAALAAPACLIVGAIRIPRARRMAIVLACLGLIGGAMAWPIFGDEVRQRIQAALVEVDAAEEDRSIATSAGLRLASWEWAWHVFLSSPAWGTGSGGYQDAVRGLPEFQTAIEREPRRRNYIDREHPHSAYLYTLACTGAIGGVLFALVLGTTAVRAWRDRLDHPYAVASLFVLGIWVIGACFDSFTLNGHDLGLLLVLVTIVLPFRPPGVWFADTEPQRLTPNPKPALANATGMQGTRPDGALNGARET